MKMNVLLLLFLAAMVVRAASQPPNPIPVPYDFYSVVLQWPKSVCNTGWHQCTKPIPPSFTLHGLWPQRYSFPCFDDCTRYPGNTKFDNNSIPDDDRNVLIQYWPNMYGDNEAFWRHEYEKHGSCVHPFYLDQLTYFLTAYRVATSTDLYSILLAAGIICGGPTTFGAIRTAIHASTRFWPTVRCNRSLTRTLQLFQIYLCFNKITNAPMDCPKDQKGCTDPIDYPQP
ncbi:ribonuclease 1-like [Quercus lobata]|nr:ribonuclease 1-like [Quercus lobata]